LIFCPCPFFLIKEREINKNAVHFEPKMISFQTKIRAGSMGSLRGNGGNFYFPPFPLKEPKGALPNLRYCLDFPAPQLIIFFIRKPYLWW
jgi:hypothetical protein